ncbi:MAG: hypothetical protein Q9220_006214 [cf. Caloplaca sp. 1 TL-2023]
MGSTSSSGEIVAEFNGKPYVNDKEWDNNWNTQNFWSCAVDPHGRIAYHTGEANGTSATATA